jgi:hypothetical protein
LMGHSNPSTTARYSHLFLDPLRVATEKAGAVITSAKNATVIEIRVASPERFSRRPRNPEGEPGIIRGRCP